MFFKMILCLAFICMAGFTHVLVSQLAFAAWGNYGCMVVDNSKDKPIYEWIGKIKLIGSLASAAFLLPVIKSLLLRLDFRDGEETFFALIICGLAAYALYCSLGKMFSYCERFSHDENVRATMRHVSACKRYLHDAGMGDSSPCKCCEHAECLRREDD